ncbi:MAG TPA: methylenetetrahydrofolate reductase [Actinomycetota bacterium]|nr:methylenetetrahydrofolate reductase [Actinomycetota bacterium]
MKVTEHLATASEPMISVEIIPPRRGGDVRRIYDAVGSVMSFRPPFIDITSHAAEARWEQLADGTWRRRVTRKAPGTFGLCAAIKHRFGVDPVPHLLCNGFTREETEDALIELHYLGIENVLAIRGDGEPREPAGARTINGSALDLVHQIADMNAGRYLEPLDEATPTDLCVGVAAYPEKHVEAPNLEWDIDVLIEKQRAGADYAVTQLFYDNDVYLRFVKTARERGVTIPIVPGLKILTRATQVRSVPATFGVDVPPELASEVAAAPDDARMIGIRWTAQQVLGLFEHGVPSVHVYVMQDTRPFMEMMGLLRGSI